MYIRVEVRGGTKSSRYEVVIHPTSLSSPYRFVQENQFSFHHHSVLVIFSPKFMLLIPFQ